MTRHINLGNDADAAETSVFNHCIDVCLGIRRTVIFQPSPTLVQLWSLADLGEMSGWEERVSGWKLTLWR